MNGTLLWEHIPLCAVSRPPFRKLNTVTLHACPAERVTLTAVGQSLRAPYLEIEVPYRMSSIGVIFLKRHSHTLHACAMKDVRLVAIGQYLWALYLCYRDRFRLYLGFHCTDFSETSYIVFSAHALGKLHLLLRWVNK